MREVSVSIEYWPLKKPFRITGHTRTETQLLCVSLTEDGITGHGEAAGVRYLNETVESLLAQTETVKRALEQGVNRKQLQQLLPAGGARNAIDCALWDLEAKKSGRTIWTLTGMLPQEVITVNTVGIDTPQAMAATASELDTPIIKVKLDGEFSLERMQAIRSARPDATLVIDANQGWTFAQLQELAPSLKALGVVMIEQPLPRGEDQVLENYQSPIPLCADESCQDRSELARASQGYQIINIKLDKTGGLTEALKLAQAAQALGLELMVGNMISTSRAMAPAFVVAQLCQWVDLDGALFLAKDRQPAMTHVNGKVFAPKPELWG